MKNISFALTTDQVRRQTKTVTRRLGWLRLKPGTVLQPVVKAQGLKKGEKVEKIGNLIRVLSVRREPLSAITSVDVLREGFPSLTMMGFIEFFQLTHNCESWQSVTRIEFEYLPDAPKGQP